MGEYPQRERTEELLNRILNLRLRLHRNENSVLDGKPIYQQPLTCLFQKELQSGMISL